MRDQLLTVADMARFLQVSKQAVYDMRYRGELPPAIRIGRQHIRWHPADVEAWMNERISETTSRRVPTGTARVAS